MKRLRSGIVLLTFSSPIFGLIGCGAEQAPAESPATIEKAQEEAKSRIRMEYGQSSKKARNIK